MNSVPQAYSKYELLFTPHLIPDLRDLRGEDWQHLVCSLKHLPETHSDVLAFSVMMIDLNHCLNCEKDSYRAQRGCVTCARQTVSSFKGSDTDLLTLYDKAKTDVDKKLSGQG